MVLEEIDIKISQQAYGVSSPALRESATYTENGESVPVGSFPMSIFNSLALGFVVGESIPGCHGILEP